MILLLKGFLIHNSYINLPPRNPAPRLEDGRPETVDGSGPLANLSEAVGSPQLHDIVLRKESLRAVDPVAFYRAGHSVGLGLGVETE